MGKRLLTGELRRTLPRGVEVLVVGAGPTGLALACTLQQAGVEVLVLDRAREGANTSRAAVIHARTLEVLDEDVARRLVAEGCIVPVFAVHDRARVLARVDFTGLPTAYPYTLMVPQSRTEAILDERLEELDGEVRRPYEATAVTTGRDGAAVAVAGPGGQRETVQARFVIGADGMQSAIREAMGIGFTGGRYGQSFVLADVRMDWPLSSQEVQLFFSPAGLLVVAPLPGGRHRVVATVDSAPEHITQRDVQTLLDQRGPGRARVHDLVWESRFRVHHRVADAYRCGPALLAGDAAHVHSPAGGQGMNIGIQDAVDLGRTLCEVLTERAPEAALDDYAERRRPVAQRVVALTDRATRIATITNPLARTARNTALSIVGRIPAVQHRLALQLAGLSESGARDVTCQRLSMPRGGGLGA